ncbi:MAG: hypothetical protein JEZ07_16845 [Phycisphaerae bacterium]|nr:hypothetical protein [Phycisphaerae bacterium]
MESYFKQHGQSSWPSYLADYDANADDLHIEFPSVNKLTAATRRRIEKEDCIATTDKIRRYYYDGWKMLASYNDSNVAQEEYFYGNYLDEVLAINDVAESDMYYLTHDHLYSPVALMDDTGTIVERYEYDAYGKRHVYSANFGAPTCSFDNCIAFTGQRLETLDDGDLEVMYYKYRYYDVYTGRFLSNDPAGYVDSLSLYEYVRSMPTRLMDVLGLWSWRKSNDVWIIQTILKNNGYIFGTFGSANNGIDGKYGIDSSLKESEAKKLTLNPKTASYTSRAVLEFQRKLNRLGCNCGCPDGLWGPKTTKAFEKCEKADKVKSRYAHLRMGIFAGAGMQLPSNLIEKPLEALWKWYYNFDYSDNFRANYDPGIDINSGSQSYTGIHANEHDWTWGTIRILTTNVGAGQFHVDAGSKIILAWNTFNVSDWRSLSNKGSTFKIDAAVVGSGKYKTIKNAVKYGGSLKNGNIKAGIDLIKAIAGNKIWRGVPGHVGFDASTGLGAYRGDIETTFDSGPF